MKRLIIVLVLLGVCLTTNALASSLSMFHGEKLEFNLYLKGVKVGEAVMSCEKKEDGTTTIIFHGYSIKPFSYIYHVDNAASVTFERNGAVTEFIHQTDEFRKERWRVDYDQQEIYHFMDDTLADTLRMETHYPTDALSAIFSLRQHKAYPGYWISLDIIGHEVVKKKITSKSAWKRAIVSVDSLKEMLEFPDGLGKRECLLVRINLDQSDNIFPGGRIKLWITNDGRQTPVKIQTEIRLLGKILKVTGKLVRIKP